MSTDDEKRSSILYQEFEPYSLAEGVHIVPTQGNGLVVETTEGLVLVEKKNLENM